MGRNVLRAARVNSGTAALTGSFMKLLQQRNPAVKGASVQADERGQTHAWPDNLPFLTSRTVPLCPALLQECTLQRAVGMESSVVPGPSASMQQLLLPGCSRSWRGHPDKSLAEQVQAYQRQNRSMHRARTYEHVHRVAANGGRKRVQDKADCVCGRLKDVADEQHAVCIRGPVTIWTSCSRAAGTGELLLLGLSVSHAPKHLNRALT